MPVSDQLKLTLPSSAFLTGELYLIESNSNLSVAGFNFDATTNFEFMNSGLESLKSMQITLSNSNNGSIGSYDFKQSEIQSLFKAKTAADAVAIPITLSNGFSIVYGQTYKVALNIWDVVNKKATNFFISGDYIPITSPGTPTVIDVPVSQTAINIIVTPPSPSQQGGSPLKSIDIFYHNPVDGTQVEITKVIGTGAGEISLGADGNYTVPITGLVYLKDYNYKVSVSNNAGKSPEVFGSFGPSDTTKEPNLVSINSDNVNVNLVVIPHESSFILNPYKIYGAKVLLTTTINSAPVDKNVYFAYDAVRNIFTYSASIPTTGGIPPKNASPYNMKIPNSVLAPNAVYSTTVALINENGVGGFSTSKNVVLIGPPGALGELSGFALGSVSTDSGNYQLKRAPVNFNVAKPITGWNLVDSFTAESIITKSLNIEFNSFLNLVNDVAYDSYMAVDGVQYPISRGMFYSKWSNKFISYNLNFNSTTIDEVNVLLTEAPLITETLVKNAVTIGLNLFKIELELINAELAPAKAIQPITGSTLHPYQISIEPQLLGLKSSVALKAQVKLSDVTGESNESLFPVWFFDASANPVFTKTSFETINTGINTGDLTIKYLPAVSRSNGWKFTSASMILTEKSSNNIVQPPRIYNDLRLNIDSFGQVDVTDNISIANFKGSALNIGSSYNVIVNYLFTSPSNPNVTTIVPLTLELTSGSATYKLVVGKPMNLNVLSAIAANPVAADTNGKININYFNPTLDSLKSNTLTSLLFKLYKAEVFSSPNPTEEEIKLVDLDSSLVGKISVVVLDNIPTSGSAVLVTNVNGSKTLTIPGLVFGQAYYLATQVNGSLTSSNHTSYSISPIIGFPSSIGTPIMNLVNGSFEASWTAPTSNGGAPILKYFVNLADEADRVIKNIDVTETFCKFDIENTPNLIYGDKYKVYVASSNGKNSIGSLSSISKVFAKEVSLKRPVINSDNNVELTFDLYGGSVKSLHLFYETAIGSGVYTTPASPSVGQPDVATITMINPKITITAAQMGVTSPITSLLVVGNDLLNNIFYSIETK